MSAANQPTGQPVDQLPPQEAFAKLRDECLAAQPALFGMQSAISEQCELSNETKESFQSSLRNINTQLVSIQMNANLLEQRVASGRMKVSDELASMNAQREAAEEKVRKLEADLDFYRNAVRSRTLTEDAYSKVTGDMGPQDAQFAPTGPPQGPRQHGNFVANTPAHQNRGHYNPASARGNTSRGGRGGSVRNRFGPDQMRRPVNRQSSMPAHGGNHSSQNSTDGSHQSSGNNMPLLLTMQPYESGGQSGSSVNGPSRGGYGPGTGPGTNSGTNPGNNPSNVSGHVVRRSTAVEDLRHSAFVEGPASGPPGHHARNVAPALLGSNQHQARAGGNHSQLLQPFRQLNVDDNQARRGNGWGTTEHGSPIQLLKDTIDYPRPIAATSGTATIRAPPAANNASNANNSDRQFSASQGSSNNSSSLHPSSSASNIPPRIRTPPPFSGQVTPALLENAPGPHHPPQPPRLLPAPTPRRDRAPGEMALQLHNQALTSGYPALPAPPAPVGGGPGQLLAPPGRFNQMQSGQMQGGQIRGNQMQGSQMQGGQMQGGQVQGGQMTALQQPRPLGGTGGMMLPPPFVPGASSYPSGGPSQQHQQPQNQLVVHPSQAQGTCTALTTSVAIVEEDGLVLSALAKSWRREIDQLFTMVLGWVRSHCSKPNKFRDEQISRVFPKVWAFMLEQAYPNDMVASTSHVEYMLSTSEVRCFFITRMVLTCLMDHMFSIQTWRGVSINSDMYLDQIMAGRAMLASGTPATAAEAKRVQAQRHGLATLQADSVIAILALPEWPKFRQQTINRHVGQFKDILGPLMDDDCDRSMASHDLYSIAVTSIELSARLQSARLTWRYSFPMCGGFFSEASHFALRPPPTPQEPPGRWRLMCVVTPEINMYDDSGESTVPHAVAKARVLLMA